MPPKSRKGVAKKATPATLSPLPAVAEERSDDPAAEFSTAAVVKEKAQAVEEEVASVAAEDAGKVSKPEAEEEAPAAAGDDKIGEETVVEKIVEETTVERIEEETVVEEVVTEKVLDSEEAPMESADNGSVLGAFGDGKGPDADETQTMEASGNESVPEPSGENKEVHGEENEMDMEEKEDEPGEKDLEEDEGEESETEEEEGDQHIVEEGAQEGEVESISGDDEENEEDDPAMYVAPLTGGGKQKEFEIFIGGLDKEAVEEDLIKVFGVFGEIQSVRIVKHPLTQKSKGFAFIRYAFVEHAKKALAELKDGTEVKGKKIRISVSQDNDTLYLGNICKTWNRDQVLDTLKSYGVEEIEDMRLPEDPRSEGKIKGFAFLEFKSHNDAMAAFKRLRKPDAVFGRNVSAKVSFAQAPLHPCEEDLQKVKTVYMEGIPKSWNETKVEELCKQYGEIEKIQLSRNFTSTIRKDFGFVEFSSRDSAIVCVEGINNAQLGEDVNVKANLAKPIYKGHHAKKSRGGYKVQKDGEVTEEAVKSKKKKKKSKSKAVHDKKETQPNLKSSNKNTPSKFPDKSVKEKKGSQTVQSAKGKKRGRKGIDTAANRQMFKKARNNQNYGRGHDRSSTGYSDPRSSYSSNPYMLRQIAYAPPAPSYTAHTYPGASGSQLRRTDLEPHAGYLPAAKPVWNPYEHEGRRAGAYDLQPRSSSGYLGDQSSYPGYASYAGYEAGNSYPSSGEYAHRRTYY